MTIAPGESDLRAYAEQLRRLLARRGLDRSRAGSFAERWSAGHIRDYLTREGQPEARPTVHVAGSKGKGSIATITESLLRAALPAVAGATRTMLYTSPDLHTARERIAIDGEPIGAADFVRLACYLNEDPQTGDWSYFERLTVLGWLAARRAQSAWQVLEVGLGGRFDTTNLVAEKAVAVIAPIDFEHTDILGDTIPEIAAEKAGIITGPCDVVIAPQRASALGPIREAATATGALVHEVAAQCSLSVTSIGLDRAVFDLQTPTAIYRRLALPLTGEHQVENAVAAIRSAELALAREGIVPSEGTIRRALSQVRLPGRCEVIGRRPMTIVDGAHTPLAARRLRAALDRAVGAGPRVFVLGVLADKDPEAIASALLSADDQVVVCPPDSSRAANPGEIRRRLRAAGFSTRPARDLRAALELGRELCGDRGTLIVTGSMYMASEAREIMLGVSGDRALGLR